MEKLTVKVNNENNEGYDSDSSPLAWEHYKKYYLGRWLLFKEFDSDKLLKKNNRKIARIKKDSYYSEGGRLWSKFELGGDCDFNFKKRCRQDQDSKECAYASDKDQCSKYKSGSQCKYKNYRKRLEKSGFSEKLELLDKCADMHSTLLNFSIMASTGRMQLVKGRSLDRLDAFLHRLNCYYTCGDESVLNSSGINKEPLINYLETFVEGGHRKNAIYNYCKYIYFIDSYKNKGNEKLIDDLIESGKKPIDTGERVVEYMKLAKRFWDAKESYFKKQDKTS